MATKDGKLFHARESRAVLREVFNQRDSNLEFLSLAELEITQARSTTLCHKREETLAFNLTGPASIFVEGAEFRMEHYDHLDMLTDHPLQQIFHIPDGGIDVQFFGLEHLAAAECQELLRESSSAEAGLADQVDFTFRRMRVKSLLQPVRMADDHHHQVIEVVGDAAGESPDGLHFLRLLERLGRAFVLGDIGDRFDDMGPAIGGRSLGPVYEEKLVSGQGDFAGDDGVARHRLGHPTKVARGPASCDLVVAGLPCHIAEFLEPGLILELDLMCRGIDDRYDDRL